MELKVVEKPSVGILYAERKRRLRTTYLLRETKFGTTFCSRRNIEKILHDIQIPTRTSLRNYQEKELFYTRHRVFSWLISRFSVDRKSPGKNKKRRFLNSNATWWYFVNKLFLITSCNVVVQRRVSLLPFPILLLFILFCITPLYCFILRLFLILCSKRVEWVIQPA